MKKVNNSITAFLLSIVILTACSQKTENIIPEVQRCTQEGNITFCSRYFVSSQYSDRLETTLEYQITPFGEGWVLTYPDHYGTIDHWGWYHVSFRENELWDIINDSQIGIISNLEYSSGLPISFDLILTRGDLKEKKVTMIAQ